MCQEYIDHCRVHVNEKFGILSLIRTRSDLDTMSCRVGSGRVKSEILSIIFRLDRIWIKIQPILIQFCCGLEILA